MGRVTRAAALALLAGLAATSAAGPAPTPTLMELLDRGREESRRGRWLWAAEAWLEAAARPDGEPLARPLLSDALRRVERVLERPAQHPTERLYHSVLREYLLLDRSSLWDACARLSRDPRYGEEAGWFLWGPAADALRRADGDVSWTRAARLYRAGWEHRENRRWSSAAARFRQALAARPDHFLAAAALADSERRLAAESVALRDDAPGVPPEVRAFPGREEERMERGESAFRAGLWRESLAWFNSVLERPPSASAAASLRARAWRASRRLGWMFAAYGPVSTDTEAPATPVPARPPVPRR
jgi:tetratricopeptide (TPR) repeat protein